MDATAADGQQQVSIEALKNRINELERQLSEARGTSGEFSVNVSASPETRKRNDRRRQKSSRRVFDFSKYNVKHIALHVAYFGWNYHGFAVQDDVQNTIEECIFSALLKCHLIDSRETSNYHRCGRTDKGVSAYSQVMSLDLRWTKCEADPANIADNPDVAYDAVLNKLLPSEIRIIAWSVVPSAFSARFDCIRRTYKYLFPLGSLDVQAMRKAAGYLIGQHDFRNLCKMDVGNGVVEFVRRVLSVEICEVPGQTDEELSYRIHSLVVQGEAFLWHQIRCIVAVLFLVGEGSEEPEIVLKLLDIASQPGKPQYTMAADFPLYLYQCDFNRELNWRFDQHCRSTLVRHLQRHWTEHSIKSSMIRNFIHTLVTTSDPSCRHVREQARSLQRGSFSRNYVPLLKRPSCETLEERIQHFSRKKRCSRNHEVKSDQKPKT